MEKIIRRGLKFLDNSAKCTGDFLFGMTPYLGYTHNGNMGDEVLAQLSKRYLSPLRLISDYSSRGRFLKLSLTKSNGYYIFGGGSILFDQGFLPKAERLNQNGLTPVLWGTGSRELINEFMVQSRWKQVLQNSIGYVRGKHTLESIQQLGLDANVIGDMGFLVNLDQEAEEFPENYVVLVPRLIPSRNNYLHSLDVQRLEMMKAIIIDLKFRGFDVVIYLPCSEDQEELLIWTQAISKFVRIESYNGSVNPFLNLVSKANAVISMRLHPGLFAYALGIPTLFLESRKKYYDAFSILQNKPLFVDAVSSRSNRIFEAVENLIYESSEWRTKRFWHVNEICHKLLDANAKISSLIRQR